VGSQTFAGNTSPTSAEEIKSEVSDRSKSAGNWRVVLIPEDYFLDNIKAIIKNGAFKSGVHYFNELTVNIYTKQIEEI
jgi:hypothetical protein